MVLRNKQLSFAAGLKQVAQFKPSRLHAFLQQGLPASGLVQVALLYLLG